MFYREIRAVHSRPLILAAYYAQHVDYNLLKNSLSLSDNHGTDDTGRTFNMMEDGSDTLSREEVAQLAARQEKFIQNLQAALVRIQNKTYGICRVSGKLIPKERLRLVPHATMSIDAKNAQNKL
ncbi:MAG: TraR/DksA family transcriptional regulator [Flavobacteriia bacterium]|nr:TraR/DksA family transcriptional regulator [Flavobacteriia bacterium]